MVRGVCEQAGTDQAASKVVQPSSGPGSCRWTDCPDTESRNDLSPGCCGGGCISISITVCLVVFSVEVCRCCGQYKAGVDCGARWQSLCSWWGVKGRALLSPDLAQGS